MSCNINFCGDIYIFLQFEDSCSHLLHSWYLVFTLGITLLIGKTSFAIHNKDQNYPYFKPHQESMKEKKGLSGWIDWGEQFVLWWESSICSHIVHYSHIFDCTIWVS
jgi:hypothetical protein